MGNRDQPSCRFVDLAGELLPVLHANISRPLADRIAQWKAFYATHAPELLERLCRDHDGVEGGWNTVATERIFPRLPELLDRMSVALDNLRAVSPGVCRRAAETLGLAGPPVVVAYVGLGNGAGWAAAWQGEPAVLLGLESIAELAWHGQGTLRGLLAHEIGHLFMAGVRHGLQGLAADPLLSLYEEGFAQYCEHLIMGSPTWHCASQDGWLRWCRAHEADLARKFLLAIHDTHEWRRFFGSWFDVDGWRQTGYYLGCRFIEDAAQGRELRDVAAWPEPQIRQRAARFLQSAARRSGHAAP